MNSRLHAVVAASLFFASCKKVSLRAESNNGIGGEQAAHIAEHEQLTSQLFENSIAFRFHRSSAVDFNTSLKAAAEIEKLSQQLNSLSHDFRSIDLPSPALKERIRAEMIVEAKKYMTEDELWHASGVFSKLDNRSMEILGNSLTQYEWASRGVGNEFARHFGTLPKQSEQAVPPKSDRAGG